ncbi:MAG TPA: Ger(x)C family spore germination protein [Firmicutes bacterium]|nr:Ger(x)C family spore germination protein [Bacillota bacterium]
MKRRSKIIILTVLALLSAGCWDYLELEFVDFVFGFGVDEIEPKFAVVAEVIKVGDEPETQFQSVVLTNKGDSFFAAARPLSKMAGMRLFWAHSQVFIISEEVAKQGVLPAIESALRDPSVRTSVLMYVARGCTAEEIFKSKVPFTDSVTGHLVNIADFHHRVPTCFNQELWEFRQCLQMSGISAVMPTIQLVQEGTEEIPQLEGTALFKNDRFVGWINGQETRFFSMMRGLIDRGPLVVDVAFNGEKGKITVEIRGNQVKIKPVVNEQAVHMKVDVQLQVSLLEMGALHLRYERPEIKAELERQISFAVTNSIRNLITKVQKETGSDVFGFGRILKRAKPKVWQALESDWDRIFPNLDVAIGVKTRISAAGVLSTPVQMRE